MSRTSKGEKCAFCDDIAVRSVSTVKAAKYFNIKPEARGRIYLCKKHYKEYKKKSKEERDLERLRW
ncbi:MAG: hypothetical protein QW701_04035 [Candidatus Nezhaarchaeales archaeon]